jgi:predicted CopG family antitoxin
MPTRRADESAEDMAQERFMSSPEYVSRRGILANAVAAKAQLYRSAGHRSLLFFLQGLSMQEGGLKAVAEDLFDMFPDHALRKVNTGEIERAFHLDAERTRELNSCLYKLEYHLDTDEQRRATKLRWFSEFLEDLCIDPEIDVAEQSSKKCSPDAPYFSDPIGSLTEFRKRRNAALLARTAATSNGSDIHRWLDRALATPRMTVIEGPSGSGKTHAVELWCRLHLGEARFVTLSGITHRTGLFQKIGATLGLAICQHASSKLQAKVEAHLATTKLMLVIDEAHFLWPQHKRNHSAPELIDWIDTVVNMDVPVALICTDQFTKLKSHVERQTGWTSDQFIHRTPWKETIETRPTKEDLRRVTESLLRYRWTETDERWMFDAASAPDQVNVNVTAAYAASNLLPLPSIRSIIDEARMLARERGRYTVGALDVKRALQSRQRSDLAIRAAFSPKPKKSQLPRPSYRPASVPDLASQEPADEQEQITNFSRTGVEQPPSRMPSTRVSLTVP